MLFESPRNWRSRGATGPFGPSSRKLDTVTLAWSMDSEKSMRIVRDVFPRTELRAGLVPTTVGVAVSGTRLKVSATVVVTLPPVSVARIWRVALVAPSDRAGRIADRSNGKET